MASKAKPRLMSDDERADRARRGGATKQRALWPDDRTATLRRLWAAGLSASEIAKELGHGLTRNAVIGKAHRIGLEPRSAALAQSNYRRGRAAYLASKPKAERKPRVPRAPKAPKPRLAAVAFGPPAPPPSIKTAKVLLLAGAGECRWPVFGEGADRLFCCGATSGKSPYCAHHKALSIGKPLKAYRFTSDHAMAQAGAAYAEAA